MNTLARSRVRRSGRWAYRTGIALQNLGRGEEAKAAFARCVSAGKAQKSSLEDARKRLEQLGG